jgi:hypothetical protein
MTSPQFTSGISSWEQFQAHELSYHDIILCRKTYIDMMDGDLAAGVILSKIIYWFSNSPETGKPRVQKRWKGELCLAKMHDDWFDECRVRSRTARRKIKLIEEKGYIRVEQHMFNGKNQCHIFLNKERFLKHYNLALLYLQAEVERKIRCVA